MKAVTMIAANRDAWALMPQLLDRLESFCKEYESDADPAALCQAVCHNFVVPRPELLAVAAVDDDGVILGHLLAQKENFFGSIRVSILQLEFSEEIPRETVETGFKIIETFGKLWGAKGVGALTRTPARTRLFLSRYGFRERSASIVSYDFKEADA